MLVCCGGSSLNQACWLLSLQDWTQVQAQLQPSSLGFSHRLHHSSPNLGQAAGSLWKRLLLCCVQTGRQLAPQSGSILAACSCHPHGLLPLERPPLWHDPEPNRALSCVTSCRHGDSGGAAWQGLAQSSSPLPSAPAPVPCRGTWREVSCSSRNCWEESQGDPVLSASGVGLQPEQRGRKGAHSGLRPHLPPGGRCSAEAHMGWEPTLLSGGIPREAGVAMC